MGSYNITLTPVVSYEETHLNTNPLFIPNGGLPLHYYICSYYELPLWIMIE